MKYADSMHLVRACRAGDRLAVETFVRAYKLPLYQLALSMLDDPQEAEEAAQDALVIALDKLDSFRGEAQLKTWLYAIALNVCRGRLRKRKTRERVARIWNAINSLRAAAPEPPHEIATRTEQSALLWNAIQNLPDDEREVIVLRYYHELDTAELTRILGVSERTIRTRVQAALDSLRATLEEEGNEI